MKHCKNMLHLVCPQVRKTTTYVIRWRNSFHLHIPTTVSFCVEILPFLWASERISSLEVLYIKTPLPFGRKGRVVPMTKSDEEHYHSKALREWKRKQYSNFHRTLHRAVTLSTPIVLRDGQQLLLCPFYRWGCWGSERWSDLSCGLISGIKLSNSKPLDSWPASFHHPTSRTRRVKEKWKRKRKGGRNRKGLTLLPGVSSTAFPT